MRCKPSKVGHTQNKSKYDY